MKRLIEAAQSLAALLGQENEALRAMDLRRAVSLLAEKTAAIAALTAAGAATSGPPDPGMATLAQQLDSLARENRQLLERAIAAQRRVIGIIVRAAASVTAEPAYAANGRRQGSRGPFALSTRA